jgi:hypothetical protein
VENNLWNPKPGKAQQARGINCYQANKAIPQILLGQNQDLFYNGFVVSKTQTPEQKPLYLRINPNGRNY